MNSLKVNSIITNKAEKMLKHRVTKLQFNKVIKLLTEKLYEKFPNRHYTLATHELMKAELYHIQYLMTQQERNYVWMTPMEICPSDDGRFHLEPDMTNILILDFDE
jgi:Ni,Fe-hydrogenase III component G